MLIDTHCHLPMLIGQNKRTFLSQADYEKVHQIISEAGSDGVSVLITIGSTNKQDSTECSLLANHFDSVFAAIGLFPHDCTADWHENLKELVPLIKSHEKIIAIGECGLDFHYPDYNPIRQKDAFKAQIELALEYNRALIIHTRNASEETLKIIDEYKNNSLRGIFHCFSENLDFANHVIELGFHIGISGTITYPKNTQLRDIVRMVGLGHVVLETDSPYLPPQHMRGKENHPRQVVTIAQYLADFLQIPLEEIATVTTRNAMDIIQKKS
jgi:TatD DNase family protein